MIKKKKRYVTPRLKTFTAMTPSIICTSVKTENLGREEFDWGDDGGVTTESLGRSVFKWDE